MGKHWGRRPKEKNAVGGRDLGDRARGDHLGGGSRIVVVGRAIHAGLTAIGSEAPFGVGEDHGVFLVGKGEDFIGQFGFTSSAAFFLVAGAENVGRDPSGATFGLLAPTGNTSG